MYIKRLWREYPELVRVVKVCKGRRDPEPQKLDKRIAEYFAKWK